MSTLDSHLKPTNPLRAALRSPKAVTVALTLFSWGREADTQFGGRVRLILQISMTVGGGETQEAYSLVDQYGALRHFAISERAGQDMKPVSLSDKMTAYERTRIAAMHVNAVRAVKELCAGYVLYMRAEYIALHDFEPVPPTIKNYFRYEKKKHDKGLTGLNNIFKS